MTSLNDEGCDMGGILGQRVPNVKANLSHDIDILLGHRVLMKYDEEKLAESAWREQFRARVRKAQGGRTQEKMAKLLGVSRDAYAKYVGRGSMMPVRLLPKFCAICDVSLEWLIEGEGERAENVPVEAGASARNVG